MAWDEVFDIRVAHVQHTHLRATARAGRLHCFAAAVEHAHIGNRAGSAAIGTLDLGATRADAAKVVAHAAATAHGLGRLQQRFVNADLAVFALRYRIAHRLYKAVDEGGFQVGTGGRVDAPAGNKTLVQCGKE